VVTAGGGSQAGGGQVVAGVDFFVSHAGPDRGRAEWLAWHLREAGYTVELDAWGLSGRRQLRHSDARRGGQGRPGRRDPRLWPAPGTLGRVG
jgi:TIR domain